MQNVRKVSIPKAPAVRRRMSRHGSVLIETAPRQIPWDLVDRLLLPIIGCHAASVVVSGLLNFTGISQVSAFALFFFLSILTVSTAIGFHSLKVSPIGKGVLITGCESPLARFLAKKLDDLGFTVFAAFKNLEESDDAAPLKASSSGRLNAIQLDVTSEVQMLEASLYITENLPEDGDGLWALVHCDMWCALGELEWIPFPVMRKSFDVNVLGAARLTQIMLPLIRRANGRVVFLSSALAHIPSPVRSVQCATQAAIEGLANCLRHELKARGVDVTMICASEFASGSAWLDDAAMLNQARAMWELLSDEQKSTYGEDYFEQAIRSLEKYTNMNGDFHSTVRALTDSIIRSFPLFRYTPLSRYEKLQTIIASHFPRAFYELLYQN
ncbi:D-beta-hydroxybutyrate dehydrogenase, mitochondrial [Uranotaenia lowii]|uniref:D-beta-hydroxybutyrate dehydrogenase, mitochondrial n=1 Tax=Uranotaenia lowii TaxID=190385 RepID=UPI0024794694|nr:D-beta-hydroxybutyrate dehydrogenase, mitochondrial [Uranotaenia lowii]XP_055592650.1 D-beta-hydroxybutyrate dehydrogenase, mitochondrial [Uranotaenia lowii]XP_055592652.1 D-beta-hydroxybutyrate dehydrogenase, mitochondrial [Uranotaenia lowii]XP_055592653.1 D-beta-hydroxybutyrate dehydrogenase, mitochondrial [Uranotaenia lowii]XP_055592654.1 D-beta-hydroxybutyrate dehydrogenase, mitochondrial [Uranotaenia lowii]XP_055592655.1 D-beta-hydroxybutyrate dehydrogenase, mitochondrial [Uranotaenia 